MNIPNFENMIPHGGLNKAHFVGNVLAEIFGVNSPIYIANAWFDQKGNPLPGYELPEDKQAQSPVYESVKIVTPEEGTATSYLGTPVFGDITFEAGTYNSYDKMTGAIRKEKYDAWTLPYSCLVDFSRQNNVVTTSVLGNNGTVKEIYGIGDWDVSIKGIAFNTTDNTRKTAHDQIEALVQWSNICDAIPVSGSVFWNKRIHRLVIKSINIQPVEGKWNVIPFTIDAVSDEAIELIL
jgi:hypothetical protein